MPVKFAFFSALLGVLGVAAGVIYWTVKSGPSAGHAMSVIRIAQREVFSIRKLKQLPGNLQEIEDRLARSQQALDEKRYHEAINLAMETSRLATDAKNKLNFNSKGDAR